MSLAVFLLCSTPYIGVYCCSSELIVYNGGELKLGHDIVRAYMMQAAKIEKKRVGYAEGGWNGHQKPTGNK